MQALSVGMTREQAGLLSLGGTALPPLAAIEILRRLRARARIDADGNFGEEGPL